MKHIGTIQGKRIELDEPISLPSGTRVRVLILPMDEPNSRRLIGLFHDEVELLENLLEAVMMDRETRPLRYHDGQSFT